jgi:hypothetical protein
MWGGDGVAAGSQPRSSNFGDLTPYLTYDYYKCIKDIKKMKRNSGGMDNLFLKDSLYLSKFKPR